MFCPRAGPSLQAQEPRLQFCRKQVFHRKIRNQGCSFTRDWICVVASRCFSHPIWTDLKRSEKIPGAPTCRWGEWIWLTGSSGRYRNSSQGLNISSFRVFEQIRDPETPITLRLQCTFSQELYILGGWNVYRLFMKALTVINTGIWFTTSINRYDLFMTTYICELFFLMKMFAVKTERIMCITDMHLIPQLKLTTYNFVLDFDRLLKPNFMFWISLNSLAYFIIYFWQSYENIRRI